MKETFKKVSWYTEEEYSNKEVGREQKVYIQIIGVLEKEKHTEQKKDVLLILRMHFFKF